MRSVRLAIFVLLCAVVPVAANDAVKVFKSGFGPGKMDSTRVAALADLAKVMDEDALDAFEWAREVTAREVVRLIVLRDDVLKALRGVEEQIDALGKAALDAAKKAGQPPPSTFSVPLSLQNRFESLRHRADRLQTEIDAEYELRERAAKALGEWVDNLPDDLRGKVYKTLERQRLKDSDWAVRKFHAKGLGFTKTPGATRLLLMRLEAERDRRVLPVVIDALAIQGGEVVVEHLLPFLTDDRWQIRAATITALGWIRSKTAVEPLIDRLEAEEGRLRGDIANALKAITGMDLGVNPARWRGWWEKHGSPSGDGDRKPEGEGEPGPDAPPPPKVPSFYGIKVLSKRILFVIDISGSMTETAGKDRTKIDVAKYELKNAILGLAEDAQFNIIFYAENVAIWKKGLVKAKGKEKRAAVKFIDEMEAVGATNIHGALKKAFHSVGRGSHDKNYKVGADTIFFLSDGQPTRGEILDPNKILACVKRWNSLRRVKIHTVGVGPGHDGTFMKALAVSSGGQYVKR